MTEMLLSNETPSAGKNTKLKTGGKMGEKNGWMTDYNSREFFVTKDSCQCSRCLFFGLFLYKVAYHVMERVCVCDVYGR